MKNIKQNILLKAKELFNERGVAKVSIREIARELNISHSNLIYHYKDRNTVINALHQQILESALIINREIAEEKSALKGLFISTLKGFNVLNDYRFFMIDFNFILRENNELHQQILKIESLRFSMYEQNINAMIAEGVLRHKQYDEEYNHFIKQLRVFSDYWLSSAQVYEENTLFNVMKYSKLFLLLFYPYLTDKGIQNFDDLFLEFGL